MEQTTQKIPIGIWYLEGNYACRKKNSEKEIERYPIDDNYIEMIKKQDLAKKLFLGFSRIANTDINLIGYLNEILTTSYDYLDQDDKISLIARMNQIKDDDFISDENKIFLTYFSKLLKEEKMNEYFEILEEFQAFNAPYLEKPLSLQEENKHYL